MILDQKGIDADPIAVEDKMRQNHKHVLDAMRTGRFTKECVKAAKGMEASK